MWTARRGTGQPQTERIDKLPNYRPTATQTPPHATPHRPAPDQVQQKQSSLNTPTILSRWACGSTAGNTEMRQSGRKTVLYYSVIYIILVTCVPRWFHVGDGKPRGKAFVPSLLARWYRHRFEVASGPPRYYRKRRPCAEVS